MRNHSRRLGRPYLVLVTTPMPSVVFLLGSQCSGETSGRVSKSLLVGHIWPNAIWGIVHVQT